MSGASRFDAFLAEADTWAQEEVAEPWVLALKKAMLADEHGKEFASTLAARPEGTGNFSAGGGGSLH